MEDKRFIGRKEVVSLPDFGIHSLQAKIDTGAYTSSVHYEKSEFVGGKLLVWFDDCTTPISFDEWKEKSVKSSNGIAEVRFFVPGRIKIGDTLYTSEFSLSKRNNLKHNVLLGRKLLSKYFVVDTSKVNIQSKNKN